MLSLSTDKTESPKGMLSNLLGLKAGEKSETFSLLLKSFSLGKAEGKELEKGNHKLEGLLHLGKEELTDKKAPLAKLFSLGNEEAADEEQFHPNLLSSLPQNGFKENVQQLIGEAKAFLKEQITQKIDTKELPKTLGGLIKLAEKSGIDVRAISFESLPKTAVKEELSNLIQRFAQTSPTTIPHSTSELVKPVVNPRTEKEIQTTKPLNALLKQNPEESSLGVEVERGVKTTKAPLFNASLNALLHGENAQENSENEPSIKLDGEKSSDRTQLIQQNKADPLSQKITEAKQLVQHVAQSMKEAVENYKPPFTRIKMQLNPQKFGEMDVTLIQRGNSVHININANTTALTVMMQNAHELKSALSTQGLNDAQMNFSSHQQQHEQQKQEHAHRKYEEYQEFETLEDEFNEIATALEIVVPRYI